MIFVREDDAASVAPVIRALAEELAFEFLGYSTHFEEHDRLMRPTDRRPIASRDRPFWRRVAAALVRANVSPNGISLAGMVSGIQPTQQIHLEGSRHLHAALRGHPGVDVYEGMVVGERPKGADVGHAQSST